MTDTIEKLTYDVKEAMEKIGLGRNAFYEAVKRGDIPSRRIGGKILIPKKAFDALFESEPAR
jgi:excisionase family DNA binding protein